MKNGLFLGLIAVIVVSPRADAPAYPTTVDLNPRFVSITHATLPAETGSKSRFTPRSVGLQTSAARRTNMASTHLTAFGAGLSKVFEKGQFHHSTKAPVLQYAFYSRDCWLWSSSQNRLLKRIDHAAPNHDFFGPRQLFDTSKPVELDGISFVLPKANDWIQINISPNSIYWVRKFSRTHTFVVEVHWRPLDQILGRNVPEERPRTSQEKLVLADMMVQTWIGAMRQKFTQNPRYTDFEMKDLELLRTRMEQRKEVCRKYRASALDVSPLTLFQNRKAPLRISALVCTSIASRRIVELSISERRLANEKPYSGFERDQTELFASLKFVKSESSR